MNVSGPIRELVRVNAPAYELLRERVYPIVAEQKPSYPLAVVRRTRTMPSPVKDEGLSKVDGVEVEITCFHPLAGTASDADEALREAIDGHAAPVTFMGVTVNIDGIEYLTTEDGYDDTAQLCWVSSKYKIRVKR